MTIDNHLSWKEHIQILSRRMSHQFFCLLRLLPLSPKVIAMVYHAFVLSRIDYCDIIWGSAAKSSLAPLDRIHHKVRNLIRDNTLPVTMPLSERRKFHVAVLAFKVLHNFSPPYLHDSLKFAREVTGRSGRNVYRLFVPSVRTTFAKCGFYYRAVAIWNGLNYELYSCTSVKSFKSLYFLYH